MEKELIIRNGEVKRAVENPKGKKFILGAEGFLKEVSFEKSTLTWCLTWTLQLSEAKALSSKSARNIIEKHSLAASIWSPWKENTEKGGFWVKYDKERGWAPLKAWTRNKNDVVFLTSGDEEAAVFETWLEALEYSEKLNLVEIQKLQQTILENQKDYESHRARSRAQPYGI